MKNICGLVLVLVFLLPTVGETSGWYDINGQPVPDTSYRKAVDGFGASLLLTDKAEDVFKRWETPSFVFEVPSIEKIKKGVAITPLIFFQGCKSDATGNCNIISNIKIWQPDGKLYGDLPRIEIWRNKPQPPAKMLGLGIQNVDIIIEPQGQLGKYRVDAEVIDLNKNVKVFLHSTFEVE